MFPFFFIGSLLCLFVIIYFVAKQFGKRILLITLFGVAVKILFGFANGAYGPFPGVDADAVFFEQIARRLAHTWHYSGIEFLSLTHRYAWSNVLAILYFVDGYNFMLAPIFNITLTTFATYNVYTIAKRLNVTSRHLSIIALILVLDPIINLYTATPMREAAIYALLTLFFRCLLVLPRRPSVLIRPSLILMIALLAFLHIGMITLVFVLGIYGFNVHLNLRSIARLRNILAAVLVAVIVNFVWSSDFAQTIPRFAKLVDPDSGVANFESIMAHQEWVSRGEGSYTYPFSLTGLSIVDIPMFAGYMTIRLIFAPFLWEIRGIGVTTLIKLWTIVVGAILHFAAFRNIWRKTASDTSKFIYLAYFLLAVTYGMSVGNDGPAFRHRTKFLWVLVLVPYSHRPLSYSVENTSNGRTNGKRHRRYRV